ncbi:MAG: hypothetical protein COB35_06025 [Gammaproteobacteria bacterium]|nr:MAG: hypothetical protein COB35_06025 [Gammaproteobacteria bacterium]
MQISSAVNSGLQGLQQANDTANRAASDIAQATTAREEKSESGNDLESTETVNKAQPASLTDSAVKLKAAEAQANTSAQSIKTADGNLGTLIDVRA